MACTCKYKKDNSASQLLSRLATADRAQL